MSLVHPLKKVMGSGSAKAGVGHWRAQRITAIALIPLTLWLLLVVDGLRGAPYFVFVAFMGSPLNAALLIAWVVAMLYHAQLGLQVVVEDYVHTPWLEISLQLAIKFLAFFGIVVSILSVARIVVEGAA